MIVFLSGHFKSFQVMPLHKISNWFFARVDKFTLLFLSKTLQALCHSFFHLYFSSSETHTHEIREKNNSNVNNYNVYTEILDTFEYLTEATEFWFHSQIIKQEEGLRASDMRIS